MQCTCFFLKIQTTGAAMGTPIALRYANLITDNFEKQFFRDYFQEIELSSPLVWFHFLDWFSLIQKTDYKNFKLMPDLFTFLKIKTLEALLYLIIRASFCICYYLSLCQKTLTNDILVHSLFSKQLSSGLVSIPG